MDRRRPVQWRIPCAHHGTEWIRACSNVRHRGRFRRDRGTRAGHAGTVVGLQDIARVLGRPDHDHKSWTASQAIPWLGFPVNLKPNGPTSGCRVTRPVSVNAGRVTRGSCRPIHRLGLGCETAMSVHLGGVPPVKLIEAHPTSGAMTESWHSGDRNLTCTAKHFHYNYSG